jgi:hypothetical protein
MTCSNTLRCLVRLLDFIEQQNRVRLRDRFGQQTALVETNVARRRTDQAAHGMAPMYSDMSKRINSMPMM